MHLVVERRIDAVADEHREADLLQRRREFLGEARLVARIAAQERPEVERRDLVILVELVALMLGQAIGVRLAHLVVSAEFPVERARGRSCGLPLDRGAVAASALLARAGPSAPRGP